MTAPALPLPVAPQSQAPAKDWAKDNNRDVRDPKPARRSESKEDVAQNSSIETEDKSKVEADPYFANLMQSFFMTQPAAANQSLDISLTGGASGVDGLYVDVPVSAPDVSSEAKTILPLGLSNLNPILGNSGGTASFNDAMMTALSLGTPPMPVSDGLAAVPVAVPQLPAKPPAASSTPDTTLTVLKDAPPSDPRLVACGFNPAGMDKFKTAALLAKPAAVATPVTNPVADQPVIIVVMKPAPEPVVAAALPQALPEKILQDMTASSVNGNGNLDSSDIDPVELRIAQSFTGKPASAPRSGPALPAQAPASPVNANTQGNSFSFLNAQVSNHIALQTTPAQNNADLSTIASLVADDAAAAPGLTANPLLLPTSTNPLTSPVVQNGSAIASNPVVQSVAQVINHNVKNDGPKDFVIQLDPPELGKLQVKMKYQKGDPLKVHIVLEKADTAAMFQRDAHGLENALKNAGLELDMASLSFELAQDGSAFQQAMGGRDNDRNSGQPAERRAIDKANILPILETSVDIYTDKLTGLTRYNLKV